MIKRTIALTLGLMLSAGCTTRLYHGGTINPLAHDEVRLYMPPFSNATDDDHAARALTEITGSALMERGYPLVQTEPLLAKARAENAAGSDGMWLQTAKEAKATHLLIGTVHEYRYKTDLDGDPAVGVTLRLVDATTGETLWQGTSAKVSVLFASVSTASQRAVRNLVWRMPLHGRWDQKQTKAH